MEHREWKRPAANGIGSIYMQLYRDEHLTPRGIISIIHGMEGNSGRYRALAERLAAEGFVIVLEDLQGHGRSANIPGSFGPENGWLYLLHDLRRLHLQAARWFPGLPLILLGHSMGSFLARDYAARFPSEVQGMILSGTAGQNLQYYAALSMVETAAAIYGPEKSDLRYGRLLNKAFIRHIKDPVNDYAWLTTDRSVCLRFGENPLHVSMTLGAYRDMLKALLKIQGTDWAEQVPPVPIYIFSGGGDPVGSFGRGPAEVYGWLKSTGHPDTSLRIYPGKRHEMLNETNRQEVIEAMLQWLNSHFSKA